MTIDEAKKIVEKSRGIQWGWGYKLGNEVVAVDGLLDADHLEALAIMLRDDQRRAAGQKSESQEG